MVVKFTRIIKHLWKSGMMDLNSVNLQELYYLGKIFVNGDFLGVHKEIYILHQTFVKKEEMQFLIFIFLISHDYYKNELHIWTDSGRPTRPLYIVENNNKL